MTSFYNHKEFDRFHSTTVRESVGVTLEKQNKQKESRFKICRNILSKAEVPIKKQKQILSVNGILTVNSMLDNCVWVCMGMLGRMHVCVCVCLCVNLCISHHIFWQYESYFSLSNFFMMLNVVLLAIFVLLLLLFLMFLMFLLLYKAFFHKLLSEPFGK